MKKFMKNPWVVGIGTTVISSLLLTLINDWINKVDWLTTLKAVLRFIGNAIVTFLNFELKVWWLLVALALLFAALLIYVIILDTKQKNIPIPFLSYTTDSALGYTWEWEYRKTSDGRYTINNLHPVCSRCGMILKQGGMYGWEMKCLRCNTTHQWKDDYLSDAQMLIEDNIKKRFQQKTD